MIEYKTGDIFDTNCDCIVNAVNSVGSMGAGLAKTFMDKYPVPCIDWNKIYNPSLLEFPKFYSSSVWKVNKDIIMFPSKIHWRNPSTISYIETSLIRTMWLIRDNDIKSIAFPAVGSGLGGLNWDDVKDLFEHYFTDEAMLELGLDKIEVYLPQ